MSQAGSEFERLDQAPRSRAGAVHDGPAGQVPVGEPAPGHGRDAGAVGQETDGAADIPERQPHPRELGRELQKEYGRQQSAHGDGPARQQAREPAVEVGAGRDGVEAERLEHRDGEEPGQRHGRGVLAEELGDVEVGQQEAQAGEQGELARADEAGKDPRRQAGAVCGIERRCAPGRGTPMGGGLHLSGTPREGGGLAPLRAPGRN